MNPSGHMQIKKALLEHNNTNLYEYYLWLFPSCKDGAET